MPGTDVKTVLMLRSAIGVFGAETVILELAACLQKTVFKPIIGVIENGNTNSPELADVARAGKLQTEFFPCKGQLDRYTIRRIRKYISDHGVSLVHTHGYKANFYGIMATAGTKVPCLATCHPWTETDYSLRARLYTFLDKFWLRRMDDVVAVSGEVSETAARFSGRKTVDCIPNGIDVSRFNGNKEKQNGLRRELGISNSAIVVGTIARLVPEKALHHLVNAVAIVAKALPRIRLILVGDGGLRADLESQSRKLRLQDRIHFLGTRRDIPELLAMMDIFVLSSNSEGMPMVILEAMAAGKAIISTSVGSIPELIENEKSGLLVAPGSDNELAGGILRLASNDSLRIKVGQSAHKLAVERYSSERMAQRYIDHYKDLVHA